MSNKEQLKSDSRTARLQVLRKNNEEVLRKQMKALAIEECRDAFQTFGRCAEKAGLWVVIQCRPENLEMSKCMENHYTEEKFIEFAKARGFSPAPTPPSMGTWLYEGIFGK